MDPIGKPKTADDLIDEAFQLRQRQEPPHLRQIRDRMRFRLMGYDLDGEPLSWEQDMRNVTETEKKLVIDPHVLKEEFAKIRAAPLEQRASIQKESKFERVGGHTHAILPHTLYRVRREGWIILAGIEGAKQEFHTVGYNYGLDNMPEVDHEFMFLDMNTLAAPDYEKRGMDPSKISMNWRTGVAEKIGGETLRQLGIDVPADIDEVSLRRIGLASALKFLIVQLADWRGKKEIMFNIGTLFDMHPGSTVKLQNGPSYHHNTRIFQQEFKYRTRPGIIQIEGSLGERDRVARVGWFARGDDVSQALTNLEKVGSKLNTDKWDLNGLRRDLVQIDEHLRLEVEEGMHKKSV